jgi:hypothetical protein
MNWEAIGAIGEVLGAAAVIITLAYLAVQIRQNSRQLERSVQAMRVAEDDAISRGFDLWRELLISDEKLSEIYIRGLDDLSALDPTERLRFNLLLSGYTWNVWKAWRSEDLISESSPEIFRHLLRHPGGREWHASHRDFLSEAFRAVLDGVLGELEAEGAALLMPHESSSMLGGAVRSRGEREEGDHG